MPYNYGNVLESFSSSTFPYLKVLFLEVASVVRVTHKHDELQASVSPPRPAAFPLRVVGLDKLHPHASQVDQHWGNLSPVLPCNQACHLFVVLEKEGHTQVHLVVLLPIIIRKSYN